MPVLDSLKYLQLHDAIDVPFTPGESRVKGKEKAGATGSASGSSAFWLDRKVVGDALRKVLGEKSGQGQGDRDGMEEAEVRKRRAREVVEEGWDLFLRVMSDGSVFITAVAVSRPRYLYGYMQI